MMRQGHTNVPEQRRPSLSFPEENQLRLLPRRRSAPLVEVGGALLELALKLLGAVALLGSVGVSKGGAGKGGGLGAGAEVVLIGAVLCLPGLLLRLVLGGRLVGAGTLVRAPAPSSLRSKRIRFRAHRERGAASAACERSLGDVCGYALGAMQCSAVPASLLNPQSIPSRMQRAPQALLGAMAP